MNATEKLDNLNRFKQQQDNSTYYRIMMYCSAPAGSGKTYSLIQSTVKRIALGDKIIIAQPTTKLIDQTYLQLITKTTLPVKRHYLACPDYGIKQGSVQQHIAPDIRANTDEGVCLFMTHESLLNLPYVPTNTWHLVIDEKFDPLRHKRISVATEAHRQEILAAFSTFEDDKSPNLKVQLSELAEEIHKNTFDDEFWTAVKLRETVAMIKSQHWTVWCDKKQYDEFKIGARNNIDFYCVLSPTIFKDFKSVTILAADFEISTLKQMWELEGVKFVPSKIINPKHLIPDTSTVEILYAMDEPWSKYKYSQKNKDGKLILDCIRDLIKDEFKNEEYLYVANNAIKEVQGERISVMSHGSNEFIDYNHMAFIPALNSTPHFGNFIKQVYGIDKMDMFLMNTLATAYQDIMRTSIRKKGCDNKHRYFFPSKELAVAMEAMFLPGCTVRRIGDISDFEVPHKTPGVKPKNGTAMSSTERSKINRAKNSMKSKTSATNCSMYTYIEEFVASSPPTYTPNTPSQITVLTANDANSDNLMCKVIMDTGEEVIKSDYQNALLFDVSEITVSNIEELATNLQMLEDKQDTCIIRGELIDTTKTSKVRRIKEDKVATSRTPASKKQFKSKDKANWMMLDFDKKLNPHKHEGEAAIEYLISQLPDYLQNTTYYYQFSSSQGINGWDTISCHVFMWLKEARHDSELNIWAKSIPLLDARLMDPIQIHYTSKPILLDLVDPLPTRSGLVKKELADCVVPIIQIPAYVPTPNTFTPKAFNPIKAKAHIDIRRAELLATPVGRQRNKLFGFAVSIQNTDMPAHLAYTELLNTAALLNNPPDRTREVHEHMKQYGRL